MVCFHNPPPPSPSSFMAHYIAGVARLGSIHDPGVVNGEPRVCCVFLDV